MSTPTSSPTSVPRSEGEERLLKVALAHLACPFEAAGPGGVCALVRSTGCPLGHLRLSDGSSISPPAKLQTIPSYICVDSLLGVCSRSAANLINGPSSSTMPPSLQRCIFGFHPKPTDLASLELYRNKLDTLLLGPGGQKEPKDSVSASVQTEDDSNTATTEPITCGVCLEVIPSAPNQLYGLPESCSHVFCAACLSTWRQQAAVNHSQNRAARGGGHGRASRRLKSLPCPSCRQPSKRLLIWPLPLTSTDEKKRALDYQERCLLGTAARARSGVNNQDEAVASEEEEDSSDTDVADYDDEDDDDVEPMFGRYFFSEPGALSIFRALNHLATHHAEEDGHAEGEAGPENAEAREAAANAHDQEVD